ncbi:MAG: hypothetical protein ACR2OI_06990 [Acidimicrobiia bacterium]
MSNRTSALVVGAAAIMLVASFSVQPEDARASESDDAAIAEIEAILAAASLALDDSVAAAITEIGNAKTNGDANSAQNAAHSVVDSIYSAAVDDLAKVSEQALWSEPVVAAELAAVGSLDARSAQAKAEISAAYDDWLAANWEWTAADVIADIEWWVQHGTARLDEIVEDYTEDLAEAIDTTEAAAIRDQATEDIARRVEQTITKLGIELARLPDDLTVEAAHAQAVADVQAAGDSAQRTVNELFDALVENQPPVTTTTTSAVPPVTTTTTSPPASTTTTSTTTTTTAAPPTTTPSAPTTTTTVVAALLPPVDPPMAEVLFMTEIPTPAFLPSTATSASNLADETPMATVGMVRRVVDSQLPAGVSTVAAGPLVVLGLVIDAIRAAGGLMALPWLLLGVYMFGLLRQQRSVLTA